MSSFRRLIVCLLLLLSTDRLLGAELSLQERLATEPIDQLAVDVQQLGDVNRGAALFYQSFLSCAKCHDPDGDSRLGPDVSKAGRDVTPEHLIESILVPSKEIKQGYETVQVLLENGTVQSGIVAREGDEELTLLDPAAGGKELVLPLAEIETRTRSQVSLMPDGLVNLLSDRQQFLDLAKYVIEIAAEGPSRARELRPAVPTAVIPAYEHDIDHARFVAAFDDQAYERGRAIYERVCANCHGTVDRPGSMPTSLRFAEGTFKNGSDPYSMYQTLTRGYGLMTPQTWMVPRQKYDVIHYMSKAFLKDHNPSQYMPVDAAYLAALPRGTSLGPEPSESEIEPWVAMNYGPLMMNTFEVDRVGPNIAYKGIAVQLDGGGGGISRGRCFALFDEDTLRFAAGWTGAGFIDWNWIQFNGTHAVHPRVVGHRSVTGPRGPGWANPGTGEFDDTRRVGRDGRRYGPLPRTWGRYRGLYRYGDHVIVAYRIGDADILESWHAEVDEVDGNRTIFARPLEIGPSSHDLFARTGAVNGSVAVVGLPEATIEQRDELQCVHIPARSTPARLKILLSNGSSAALNRYAASSPPPRPLKPLTAGGPARWSQSIKTAIRQGRDDGPFALDILEIPVNNPWNAQLRITGFDFYPDGDRAAVCTWDGDVWMVSGFLQPDADLEWRRIAAGLFQPLGLKLRDGTIFVTCRDQLARLVDSNGDGEIDFYECFNGDHQVSEHFHEFAMGLQTDAEGNFYYAKSARHALPAVVPQHGTLLKVRRDGQSTEILATGFRAANGVCLNPDGTFFVTDQEGHWTPKNRINLVHRGGFYGNMFGYSDMTDNSDSAMEQPLCWITNEFDRSPAEPLWVTSDKWGPLRGKLLNVSYGYGRIYVVPIEITGGQAQGGMAALPLPVTPTGLIRGRFHPTDGQLYVCGMYSWAGSQTQPGGFYRVRYTGKPMDLPVELRARSGALEIAFTDPLDAESVADLASYQLKTWQLKRSREYGSEHIDEKPLAVSAATLLPDGKTVRLSIPDLAPTQGMEIKYRLQGHDNRLISGRIHNTIHRLAD